jgi:hypothetical protein
MLNIDNEMIRPAVGWFERIKHWSGKVALAAPETGFRLLHR